MRSIFSANMKGLKCVISGTAVLLLSACGAGQQTVSVDMSARLPSSWEERVEQEALVVRDGAAVVPAKYKNVVTFNPRELGSLDYQIRSGEERTDRIYKYRVAEDGSLVFGDESSVYYGRGADGGEYYDRSVFGVKWSSTEGYLNSVTTMQPDEFEEDYVTVVNPGDHGKESYTEKFGSAGNGRETYLDAFGDGGRGGESYLEQFADPQRVETYTENFGDNNYQLNDYIAQMGNVEPAQTYTEQFDSYKNDQTYTERFGNRTTTTYLDEFGDSFHRNEAYLDQFPDVSYPITYTDNFYVANPADETYTEQFPGVEHEQSYTEQFEFDRVYYY